MLYLVYAGADVARSTDGPWEEIRPVADRLVLVHSDASRSAVYHALKDSLPGRTTLVVAELVEVPKMKGIAPGALAWARRHLS